MRVLRESPIVMQALQTNYAHAVNCAAILLPETFHENDLFLVIAGLSYSGLVFFLLSFFFPFFFVYRNVN